MANPSPVGRQSSFSWRFWATSIESLLSSTRAFLCELSGPFCGSSGSGELDLRLELSCKVGSVVKDWHFAAFNQTVDQHFMFLLDPEMSIISRRGSVGNGNVVSWCNASHTSFEFRIADGDASDCLLVSPWPLLQYFVVPQTSILNARVCATTGLFHGPRASLYIFRIQKETARLVAVLSDTMFPVASKAWP